MEGFQLAATVCNLWHCILDITSEYLLKKQTMKNLHFIMFHEISNFTTEIEDYIDNVTK